MKNDCFPWSTGPLPARLASSLGLSYTLAQGPFRDLHSNRFSQKNVLAILQKSLNSNNLEHAPAQESLPPLIPIEEGTLPEVAQPASTDKAPTADASAADASIKKPPVKTEKLELPRMAAELQSLFKTCAHVCVCICVCVFVCTYTYTDVCTLYTLTIHIHIGIDGRPTDGRTDRQTRTYRQVDRQIGKAIIHAAHHCFMLLRTFDR